LKTAYHVTGCFQRELFKYSNNILKISLNAANSLETHINQGGAIMGNNNCGSGFFGDSTVLFFILVFLLLFWGCTGPACD
jgi:hypothetical protein